MSLRSVLGSLQLPVAVFGAFIAVYSFRGIAQITPIPEQGGLPGGLAMLFLYAFGIVGIAVCALGLAIPPGDGFGIAFTRPQRYLFGLSALGAIGSAVLPVVLLPLVIGGMGENAGLVIGLVWVGPLAISVLALGGGFCWRGVTALVPYARDADTDGGSEPADAGDD